MKKPNRRQRRTYACIEPWGTCLTNRKDKTRWCLNCKLGLTPDHRKGDRHV